MLYEQIQSDQLEARKSGDKSKAALLSSLLSESYKRSKEKNQKPDLDTLVFTSIQKMLKNINESLGLPGLKLEHQTSLEAEKTILEAYMPQKLTDSELMKLIEPFMSEPIPIRAAMPYLKANYSGRYDPKKVADIIQSLGKK